MLNEWMKSWSSFTVISIPFRSNDYANAIHGFASMTFHTSIFHRRSPTTHDFDVYWNDDPNAFLMELDQHVSV
jgi:hypothetical protein